MDWQAALRARLIAAAPVAALVGQRIYWVQRPQAAALPAITLQTISDDRPQHMKGLQELRASRVQLDVWAETYGSTRQVSEAAIAALLPEQTGNGIRFERTFVAAVRDSGEQTGTTFVHRTTIDLIIHHAAA